MKKYGFGTFFLTIMLFSAQAQAETLYFAAQTGFSAQETSTNEDINNPANSFDLNSQAGVNMALAAGVSFGMLRGEIEAVYRYNANDKTVDSGGGQAGADGSYSTAQVFLNGYLEMGILGLVTPYVGVGVGYGTATLNLKSLDGTVIADDKDEIYSYQLMVGAAANLTDSWSVTAEYRYFNTITDAEMTLQSGLGTVESTDIKAQEIRFGIRYWLF